MASIRWGQDPNDQDASNSGTVSLFSPTSAPSSGGYSPSDPPPIITPGKPIASMPAPQQQSDVWTTGGNASPNDAVAMFYRTMLGRDPEAGAAQSWLSGAGGDLSKVQMGIFGSPEAQAYRSRPSGSAPSGSSSGASGDWISQTLREVSSTDDENYWRRVIGADPKVAAGDASAIDYWKDRIRRGDGSSLVKSGQLKTFQDGPNASQFGYDDPSSLLYLSSIMKRLQDLQQPRHDPVNDQLAQFIQQLVSKSQQAPYTAGDDAALTARYREPLTQARDAAMRQNTEQASHRGFLPSSGLMRRMNTDTQGAYIKGIAQGANDLGVRAVDESHNRALQAIQALSGLVQNNRTEQDRQDAVGREVVNMSSLFPQFDERRLNELLSASGEGPGAAISGLTSLGTLGLNATGQNNQNSANSGQALADFLFNLIRSGGH